MNTLLVVAAGAGRRMGMPKALVEIVEGESFLERILSVWGGRGPSVVVIGASASTARRRHEGLRGVDWVINDGWERSDMLASLRMGLEKIEDGRALVWPVDAPTVGRGALEAILQAAEAQPEAEAWVPTFEGQRGHPVLLGARLIEQVIAGGGPHLRALLDVAEVVGVEVTDSGVLRNLNDPETLERWRAR